MKISIAQLMFIAAVMEQYREQVGYSSEEETLFASYIEQSLLHTIEEATSPAVDLRNVECYNRLMA